MNIKNNYINIKRKISSLTSNSERKIDILIATKNHSHEYINTLINMGHNLFGENKVQEALSKWEKIDRTALQLHMIGHLQTNKVPIALQLFNRIETLDSEKLAKKIYSHIGNSTTDFLIQISTDNNQNRGGIFFKESKEFIDYCKIDLSLPIKGVMCIPPKDISPHRHFEIVRDIAYSKNLHVISMGMSNDFSTAISCGSTQIRLGRIIFK